MHRGTAILFRKPATYGPRTVTGLTPSQESIITLVALSLTYREIGEILRISKSTVSTTMQRAMRRAGVKSQVQLVLWWHNQNRKDAA